MDLAIGSNKKDQADQVVGGTKIDNHTSVNNDNREGVLPSRSSNNNSNVVGINKMIGVVAVVVGGGREVTVVITMVVAVEIDGIFAGELLTGFRLVQVVGTIVTSVAAEGAGPTGDNQEEEEVLRGCRVTILAEVGGTMDKEGEETGGHLAMEREVEVEDPAVEIAGNEEEGTKWKRKNPISYLPREEVEGALIRGAVVAVRRGETFPRIISE